MDTDKKLISLQEISKVELSKILRINTFNKYLIIDPQLIPPLEKVCGVKWLKDNGISKIFKVESHPPNFDVNAIFYMIPCQRQKFQKVVDQIRSQIPNSPPNNKFHIICVPQYLHHYNDDLEKLGLYGIIKLHNFHWMPINLDCGILSLELNDVFSQLFAYDNLNQLSILSKALWKLFFVVGKPKCMLTLGKASNSILKQYENFCNDLGDSDQEPAFGGLIIIDRNVDLVSSLLMPGVYSALLAEVYTVTSGSCVYKETDEEKSNSKAKKAQISLNLNSTQDSVYSDIKNRYFTEVTTTLSALTHQLKSEHALSDLQLDEIKKFIKTQLQETKQKKKLIANHLLAAESIINVIGPRFERIKDVEFNIMRNIDKSSNFNYLLKQIDELEAAESLRLFCLLHSTQKLSEKEQMQFRRKFNDKFGYDFMLAHQNVAKLFGYSKSKSGALSKIKLKFAENLFYSNAKTLRQFPANPENVNLKYPTCPSYVFGGTYIPLITQICGLILNSTPLEEIKSKLEVLGLVNVRNERGYPLQQRSLLIYLIGGVTYAEIAACSLLENLMAAKIVIMSDRIVTGNDLMASLYS